MEPREGRAFAADGHARDARQSAPGSSAESPLLASSSAAASHQHQQQQLAQTPAATLPAIPADPSAREQQAAAKQSLKQWWTKFTKQQQQQQQSGSGPFGKKDDTSPTSSGKGVFGVPLTESLKYAGVAISMVGPDGVNQVYGYVISCIPPRQRLAQKATCPTDPGPPTYSDRTG